MFYDHGKTALMKYQSRGYRVVSKVHKDNEFTIDAAKLVLGDL